MGLMLGGWKCPCGCESYQAHEAKMAREKYDADLVRAKNERNAAVHKAYHP